MQGGSGWAWGTHRCQINKGGKSHSSGTGAGWGAGRQGRGPRVCCSASHPPQEPGWPDQSQRVQHSQGHRLLYPHCVSLCLWLICFPSGWGPHCPAPFLAECGGPEGLGLLPQVFSQTPMSAPVPRAFLVSPRHP